MSPPPSPPSPLRDHVVVGTDGSPAAMWALDRAVVEARRRRVPLEIVHGWSWGGAYEPMDDASDVLAAAERRVVDRDPALPVVTTAVSADAASALVDRSADACLTVLGSRGHGGFAGLLLGSVTLRVAAHCHRPLLVVRGADERTGPPTERPVVLGLKPPADSATRSTPESPAASTPDSAAPSTPGSATDSAAHPAPEPGADSAAIGFAFAEAARQRAGLLVVHARPGPDRRRPTGPGADPTGDPAAPDALTAWRARYPQVAVETRAVPGDPARTLVEAASAAEVVVIAVHRRTTGLGLQLGPVTHALLHHSPAPVALVPCPAPPG
ncbi:universal stress protein [Streptomyces sp. HSW2009]|uniref:universal stress protein n=1 Tax=Streptomyces sp. HSW2009 TaxID=3142890 RepID=UPI0032EE4ED2